MPTNDRIKILFQRFAENTCTREELEEMYAWMENAEEEEAYALMDKRFEKENSSDKAEQVDWEYMFQQIVQKKAASRVRRTPRRITVAAAVLLLVGLGTYYAVFNNRRQPAGATGEVIRLTDIKAPVTNRATITLADGTKVYLDSAGNGELARQGSVRLNKKADGQIVYSQQAVADNTVPQFNVINNPRGSKVLSFVLSDGSKVWLNTGSSVTFPVAFSGNERRISMTGEAYFEVQHNASKPFIVSNGQVDVQVLGTHFNVNAYADENAVQVTLLQGSVKVMKDKLWGILKPGQQAQVAQTLVIAAEVNTDEVMAWKNGFFHFESADIKTILRQFARWYDVEVVYEGPVSNEKYFSIMNRNSSLASVLNSLQASGLKFKLENKKLIIQPQ